MEITSFYQSLLKRIGILILLFLVGLGSQAQKRKTMRFMFYNVENLFDTIDSPNTKDTEFTPQSEKRHTSVRYNEKLFHLSKVIQSTSPRDLPEIIGLCEVENKQVLKDLADQELIKKGKYQIVHFDSPDQRGIDNALLYRKKEFSVVEARNIALHLTTSDRPTRDILYVKGYNRKKDTIHILVNHFPSRWGGKEKSEPKRLEVAKQLRAVIDTIINNHWNPNIVVMGDFNDTPSDSSMMIVIDGFNENIYPKLPMINTTASLMNDSTGTYFYRGNWEMLDQIIVSKTLFQDGGLKFQKVRVHKKPWMLYENKKYNTFAPSRSYGGNNYYGGFSDHLPVILTTRIKRPAKR